MFTSLSDGALFTVNDGTLNLYCRLKLFVIDTEFKLGLSSMLRVVKGTPSMVKFARLGHPVRVNELKLLTALVVPEPEAMVMEVSAFIAELN